MPRAKKKAAPKTAPVKETRSKASADIPEETRVELSTEVFRLSDRLKAFIAGSKSSMGASCNTHFVGDSRAAIARALAWAMEVGAMKGAPSLDLSRLRPKNSPISSGGLTTGIVKTGAMIDPIIDFIRRYDEENKLDKNGAGIVWLDYNHEDLDEFLSADYKHVFRGVYLPRVSEVNSLRNNKPLLDKLAKAYNENRIFLCKRPENDRFCNQELLLNLCTEIEIPHNGFCILGVINLSRFNLDTIEGLSAVMRQSAESMYSSMEQVLNVNTTHPLLGCSSPANRQFGLGVSGLASLLANCGVSYVEFTDAFLEATDNSSGLKIETIAYRAATSANKSPSHKLVAEIVRAYADTASVYKYKVSRMFCVQPSATGAYKCADIAGYHSSPELQPVIGIRDKDGVHTIRKSGVSGNKKIVFHPDVETINDVPYDVYDRLSACWQDMMNATELAHRHSTCWYGDKFTSEDLVKFLDNPLRLNLYYRLQSYNEVALNKSQVGEGLEDEGDFDPNELINKSCGIQKKGNVDCECAA